MDLDTNATCSAWIRNISQLSRRKNVPNTIYNAHGWLIKQKHIAVLYDEQERVCWMTLSIFALPS